MSASITAEITNARINMRAFAVRCGHVNVARIPHAPIVEDDISEIEEALYGDDDHIVERLVDDAGTPRIVIWRRGYPAPHFIELSHGMYLAPYRSWIEGPACL